MSAHITLEHLRDYAVARTLFAPRDLESAVRTLGFVQIDPIRAPARAQDLILRHRAEGYRAGDAEKHYASLPFAEEIVHVYGILPRESLGLLHPRPARDSWHVEREHPRLAKRILAHIGKHLEKFTVGALAPLEPPALTCACMQLCMETLFRILSK